MLKLEVFLMAKIFFDAATSGNPGRSTCGIVIKENDIKYRPAYICFLFREENQTKEHICSLILLVMHPIIYIGCIGKF